MIYLWLKALHVIAVIAWMASLLYLPRLMIYHCGAELGSKQSETFKIMEQRLLFFIANPAMIATWLFGVALMLEGEHYRAGWMQTKFALVLVLSALHGFNVRWVKDFAADRNQRTARFYRIMNEVPALLMVAIVILAIVKPF
jgi:protoporphyrinogen IX oxidase